MAIGYCSTSDCHLERRYFLHIFKENHKYFILTQMEKNFRRFKLWGMKMTFNEKKNELKSYGSHRDLQLLHKDFIHLSSCQFVIFFENTMRVIAISLNKSSCYTRHYSSNHSMKWRFGHYRAPNRHFVWQYRISFAKS